MSVLLCLAFPLENVVKYVNVLSIFKTLVRPKDIHDLYFSSNTQ